MKNYALPVTRNENPPLLRVVAFHSLKTQRSRLIHILFMGRATGTASLPISREPFSLSLSLSLFVSFSEALSPVGRVAILRPAVMFRDNDVGLAFHSTDFPPLS